VKRGSRGPIVTPLGFWVDDTNDPDVESLYVHDPASGEDGWVNHDVNQLTGICYTWFDTEGVYLRAYDIPEET